MVTELQAPVLQLRRWLLYFWCVPALVGTVGFVLVPSRLNPGLSFLALLASQLLIWGAWVLWTTLLWRLGDSFARRGTPVLAQVLAYSVSGVFVVVAQIFWQSAVGLFFGIAEARGVESTLVIGVRTNGDYFVVIYAALVFAQLAFRWLATLQAERIRAAQVNTDLAQAQLTALRTQLQPHFLFNALNSVVTLIARDPTRAQQVVVQLAELLRMSLRTSELQEVPLSHELELTRRYLALEEVRFADRLTVQWQLSAVPDTLVPVFALQPLVENALVHGIARSAQGGTVTISTRFDTDSVTLEVHNTGPSLWPPSTARGTGTALENLRARLERLYGTDATLRLHDASDGSGRDGVIVTLRLPLSARPASGIRNTDVNGGAGSDVRTPVVSKSDHGLLPT
jgi:sensor histidine kinase YesM